MIKKKNRGTLVVISGPSGVGKGTICNELKKIRKHFWLSISATSRKPRKGEVDGENYFFISKEEFEERIKNNDFLEYAIVHNNDYYGTPKKEIEAHLNSGDDVILEIDIEGALKIKEKYPETLFIFILPPSMDRLIDRLIKRGTESKEKIVKRFRKAYKEINEVTKYNYVVVNDNLEKAVNKVNSIMTAERCRVDRIEEILLNNKEESIHELLVEKDLENKMFELKED